MTTFDFLQWTKSNGLTLRCSAHIARHQGSPWVIFCHGFTGQRMGPGYLFVKFSRHLESLGISSLRFDFCGSGESDGLFYDMTVPVMEEDLLFIVNKVKQHFSPSHLILFGHSFGGMIASMRAGDVNADGLVLLSPVGNPEGLIHRRKDLLEAGVNREGYYENGPHEMSVRFLDTLISINPIDCCFSSFKGAVLLMQGDADTSISVEESARYIDRARTAGIKNEHVIIHGADHNYTTVTHVNTIITKTGTWLKEHFN